MSKHTEGPWVIDEIQTEDYRVNISSYKSNVACAYHINDDPVEPDEETNANAALIAAAPELLDALKKLVGWYDCFQLKEGEADLPVIVKSRAAIAKAEGR